MLMRKKLQGRPCPKKIHSPGEIIRVRKGDDGYAYAEPKTSGGKRTLVIRRWEEAPEEPAVMDDGPTYPQEIVEEQGEFSGLDMPASLVDNWLREHEPDSEYANKMLEAEKAGDNKFGKPRKTVIKHIKSYIKRLD
jgi:hypothetical protein